MPAPLDPDFRPQYHQLHRVGRPGAWRSIVGALVLLAVVFLLVPAIAGAIFFAGLMVAGYSVDEAGAVLDVTAEATPAGLALLNIVIAAAIPASWAITWWLHRLKPRVALGPVRIAVTGRKVSPPLFESLELLGRERSIARLHDAMFD